MTLSLSTSSGVASVSATPGVNSVLVLSVSGGLLILNGGSETWTDGGGNSGWRGFGTPTVAGNASGVSSLSTDLSNGVNVYDVRATKSGVPVVVAPSDGTNTVNISSTAPTNIGSLNGIVSPISIEPTGGTTSLVVSDYAGAGSKTYVLAPGVSPVDGTISGPTFSTISYRNLSGLTFKGSNLGGCTFQITGDLLIDLTLVGGGGVTNTLDLSALTGYSRADNGNGTGTVTMSNGKVITYSGMSA